LDPLQFLEEEQSWAETAGDADQKRAEIIDSPRVS
jgi:hypothetical protein